MLDTLAMAFLLADSIAAESSPWGSYVKVLFVLGAILCFAIFALFFFKKRLGEMRKSGRTGALEVVGRLGLEPRRTLYLIRAGQQYFAVSASENGVRFLLKLRPESFTGEVVAAKDAGDQPNV